jgi:galactose-1-phosphate uridylyltransferase
MDRISPELLNDPIGASLRWFDLLSRYDRAIRYYAINWNYMPTSGGSLFHPHFQVVANPVPTTFQARLIAETAQYRSDHGSAYWADLVAYEKREKERYLFAIDGVEFLTSFSPGGIFGEVLALFPDKTAVSDLSEADWQAFLEGLCRILRCFHRMNLDNLNMTLFLSQDGDADFSVQARIMPRVLIPPWGTSDVNYFEKGHDEKVVIFSPEDLAEAIRATPP